jgi:TetR/AcrR family transcriptional repressor of nem operon
MPTKDTRSSILEKSAQIIHKKGYNHTGIKEILDAAGVPKGSFYHFFKSKEDFGLNLLDHYAGFIVKKAGDLLKKTDTPPLQRLKSFFDDFRCFFKDNACELGCPIGNLSQEMGDLYPALRNILEEIFQLIVAPVSCSRRPRSGVSCRKSQHARNGGLHRQQLGGRHPSDEGAEKSGRTPPL